VLATDEAGNRENIVRSSVDTPQFNRYHWLVDSRPPITQFLGALPRPDGWNKREFQVRFASDEIGGGFECRLTTPTGATMVLPYQAVAVGTGVAATAEGFISLPADGGGETPNGEYELQVTAVDLAGNRGSTIASAWLLDTRLPVATISHDAELGLQRSSRFDNAVFSLLSDEPSPPGGGQQAFLCALDCLREVVTCGEQQQWSAGNSSSYAARVTYAAFGADGELVSICGEHFTPLPQPFEAPPTAIVAARSGGDGGVHTAQCRDSLGTATDSPSLFSCASPLILVGLREGRHVLRVRAVDPAGNIGDTTIYGWIVDLQAPTAYFAAGSSSTPPALSALRTVTFRQVADESTVTFGCELSCKSEAGNSGIFVPCTGQPAGMQACSEVITYSNLAGASYRYRVRAIDAAGNQQYRVDINGRIVPSYAEHRFVIDLVPPRVTLEPAPPAVIALPVATFTFTADEGGDVVFECRHCMEAAGQPPLCGPVEACDGAAGYRVPMVQEREQDRPMFRDGDPTQVVLCPTAVAAGCGVGDYNGGSGSGKCSRGFLRVCGVTHYSYANSRIQDMAFAAVCVEGDVSCITENMLTHTLVVRAIDGAGNAGPITEFFWLYGTWPSSSHPTHFPFPLAAHSPAMHHH